LFNFKGVTIEYGSLTDAVYYLLQLPPHDRKYLVEDINDSAYKNALYLAQGIQKTWLGF
jgi:hypothetical protein